MKSSFSGVIEEIPGISVDNFKDFNKKAYFLSHAHRDHTVGLNDRNKVFRQELSKNNAFIYMSDITAKIFNHEYEDLERFVKPLKFGERDLVSLPATEDEEDVHFDVTLIPAGHCLGSAMILFKTNRKTVLYTGDFRYTLNDVNKITHLHNPKDRSQPIQIDTMYVDTTFLDMKKEDLPKRSESIEYLLREIEAWMVKGPEYKVALKTSANYGYEFVFNEIYKKFNKKVHVADSKWILYSQIPTVRSSVTNDINDTDIHLCTRKFGDHSFCEIGVPSARNNFLTIKLSALQWDRYKLEEIPLKKIDNFVHVCFSTHCSRSELVYFVNHFRPKKIKGFPNEYKVNVTPKKIGVKVVLSPIKRRRIKL